MGHDWSCHKFFFHGRKDIVVLSQQAVIISKFFRFAVFSLSVRTFGRGYAFL